MRRVGLGGVISPDPHRERRQVCKHGVDHAAGVDPDRRHGVVEAVPQVRQGRGRVGQRSVLGPDPQPARGEGRVDLGVGRVGTDQDLQRSHAGVVGGLQRRLQGLDEPGLVLGDVGRRAEIEQHAAAGIQPRRPAEGGPVLQVLRRLEPFVEEGRPGDPDRLGPNAMDLAQLADLVVVPGEHPVRMEVDQTLGGQIVPAIDRQGGGDPQAAGRLHIIRLLRKPHVQRADHQHVRPALPDESDDAGVGRSQSFHQVQRHAGDAAAQQAPDQAARHPAMHAWGQVAGPAACVEWRGARPGEIAAVASQLAQGEYTVATAVRSWDRPARLQRRMRGLERLQGDHGILRLEGPRAVEHQLHLSAVAQQAGQDGFIVGEVGGGAAHEEHARGGGAHSPVP